MYVYEAVNISARAFYYIYRRIQTRALIAGTVRIYINRPLVEKCLMLSYIYIYINNSSKQILSPYLLSLYAHTYSLAQIFKGSSSLSRLCTRYREKQKEKKKKKRSAMFRFARGGDGTGLISRADIAAPRERARAALIARDPRAFISLSAARRRERERD